MTGFRISKNTRHYRYFPIVLAALLILAATPVANGQDYMDHTYGEELFKEGVVHFNNGEYESAIDFFRKSLGRNPEDVFTHYFLGMAYYRAGFEENAQFELETLQKNEPENSPLSVMLAQFLQYLNNKKFLARDTEKSTSYSLVYALQGDSIGKYKLSKITGLDVDGEGNIYAASFGSKIALKLSPEGDPLHQYADRRFTPGRLYDIVLSRDGGVYISDFTNDRIYRFDGNGRFVGTIGSSGFDDGQFYGPTSLAVDGKGNLFVIDSGNMRIVKFNPEGEFLLSFGRQGDDDGEFDHPSGIAVDGSGRIFVSDHGKKAVFVYDGSGNFIRRLKGIELTDPYGLSFWEDRLLVSDRTGVKIYDPHYSTWTSIETGEDFSRVLDARIGPLGQLTVSDFEQDRLMRFIPGEDKYRNLNVIVNGVDASSFPAIVYRVSVLDADGLPVYGLDSSNFLLKIGGGAVQKIDLRYNERRDSRLNMVLLVEKSKAMEQYAQDVDLFISNFLKRASASDEMMVINYNRKNWVASDFTNSTLRTQDAVRENRYEAGKAFDAAFRRAVDYANKRFYKKAIVVITDGNLESSSFQTYSMQSCMDYAANNQIPVYFVFLGQAPNRGLDLFARSTGGATYEFYRSNEIPFLYDRIRSNRTPEYIIFFNDVYDPKLKNLFVESEVEVDFNGRFGRGMLGFIYP
jgi:DNA-binding beta-propeller fold protein YncE